MAHRKGRGWAVGALVARRWGWAMAPLVALGWEWAMAPLFRQGWDREGCAARGMY